MTGLARSTVSPSSSIMIRSTPWVDGCCGPMLRIIVSSMSGHGPPVSTSSRVRVTGERPQLLRALVGLRLEPRSLVDRRARRRSLVVVAHRGLGSPLNVTGTRAGASSLRSG